MISEIKLTCLKIFFLNSIMMGGQKIFNSQGKKHQVIKILNYWYWNLWKNWGHLMFESFKLVWVQLNQKENYIFSWIGRLDSRTGSNNSTSTWCKQTRFYSKGQISCKKTSTIFLFSWGRGYSPINQIFFLKFKFAVQLILWLIDKEG